MRNRRPEEHLPQRRLARREVHCWTARTRWTERATRPRSTRQAAFRPISSTTSATKSKLLSRLLLVSHNCRLAICRPENRCELNFAGCGHADSKTGSMKPMAEIGEPASWSVDGRFLRHLEVRAAG